MSQTQSRLSGDVGIIGATQSRITNLSLPVADTEVSHVLSSGLKSITIRARGLSKLQFAFTSTESDTKFITIEGNASYSEDGLSLAADTLYIQANNSSEIVEILEFY